MQLLLSILLSNFITSIPSSKKKVIQSLVTQKVLSNLIVQKEFHQY